MWQASNGIIVQRLLGGRSNVFLVSNHQAAILVDTSWQPARPRLRSQLDSLGFHNERSLTALFLTHAHFDHTENAAWIRERYKPQVLIQQSEADYLRIGSNALSQSPKSFKRRMYARFSSLLLAHLHYQPAEADLTFNSEMDLGELGLDARLLHTPGHTAGSSSLIIGDRIAVVGDTMHHVFPHTAYPPFLDNPEALLESWAKLLDTGCRVFLPSHGRAVKSRLVERELIRRREL